jgi:hypothetical protein
MMVERYWKIGGENRAGVDPFGNKKVHGTIKGDIL